MKKKMKIMKKKMKKKIKKTNRIINTFVIIVIAIYGSVLPVYAALIGGEGGFYYSINRDETATVEEYHGSAEDIVIPSEVFSNAVTAIADNTFSRNNTIKSVVIPNTVTSLGEYAFFGCSSLERAVVPTSITDINAATFYNCTNLREVTIPASVTKIAANAFYGCENLTIKGDRNTAAEAYALEHGYSFEDLHPRLLGDIDGDSAVTSGDALSVLRMSAALEDCSAETLPIADIDGDETITSGDAIEVLRYSASLPANERIGQPL